MRFAFPHGEVNLSHFVQPAVLSVDSAKLHVDGSTGSKARVEPVDDAQDNRTGGLWSLFWAQKLLSTQRGGKPASQ